MGDLPATVNWYEQHADTYAATTQTADPYLVDQVTLLADHAHEIADGQRPVVADIGCGAGRDLRLLEELGCRPLGFDLSTELVSHAAQHASVTVADMTRLPLGDETLDGALMIASLLHLPDGKAAVALGELRRVLKPDAHALISVKEGTGTQTVDGRLFRFYRPEQLDHVLRGCGFQISHASRHVDPTRPDTVWLSRLVRRAT